ncbi:MAG: hypothetical protein F7C34_02485 [Desulfurococcales archaeon]|nr:hypothetical protein [Desulfurococcales archaeon]
MKYWDILIGITIADLLLSILLLIQVAKLVSRPMGTRLFLLSIIFVIQSIIGLINYVKWEAHGYGSDIALPMLLLQTSILAGIVVLVDIVRT